MTNLAAAYRPASSRPVLVGAEQVYSGWIAVRRLSFRAADGAILERHVEDHGDAAVVLPYDPERRVAMLVSLPRAPVIESGAPDLLEAIAGRRERETAEECARREALEEAGLRLSALEFVGRLWTMPSISTERISYFLASYCADDIVAAGGGAPGEQEQIATHEIDLGLLWRAYRAGVLADLKTAYLVQMLQLRRPHLFGAETAGSAGDQRSLTE